VALYDRKCDLLDGQIDRSGSFSDQSQCLILAAFELRGNGAHCFGKMTVLRRGAIPIGCHDSTVLRRLDDYTLW
jgi:hypothetical protein